MKKITFYLVLFLFLFSSCRKSEDITNIYFVNNSELWVNVDETLSDLTITFISQDTKEIKEQYIITYVDKNFNPSLKTREIINNGVNEKWVLVHSDFDKTDKITIVYNDNIYETSGFNFQEKRLLYINQNISGDINITDADISILQTVVYVN